VPITPPQPRLGHSWGIRLGTLWLPLVPFVSAGTLSWAAAGYGAARLRSPLQGLAAAAYFALAVVVFATGDPNSTEYSSTISLAAILPGGTVHGVVLRTRVLRLRASLSDPLVELARVRRSRRQSARHILAREPALAGDLRIGRPDLPRQYDDGGLIDINHVPEHVLTTALGITPEQARRIVTERQRTGGFSSVEEIAARGLLPNAVLRSLAEVLVAIR
jgi:DNA uptake protein ComE-like DNA-binding protein